MSPRSDGCPDHLQESTTAYTNSEKELIRIKGKSDTYMAKMAHQGKGMSEIRESAEGKKLGKKLQDAEDELQEAYERMKDANTAFAHKMPRQVGSRVRDGSGVG